MGMKIEWQCDPSGYFFIDEDDLSDDEIELRARDEIAQGLSWEKLEEPEEPDEVFPIQATIIAGHLRFDVGARDMKQLISDIRAISKHCNIGRILK